MNKSYDLPDDLIVFISGVPGVGKTTISYELLKLYKEFRLVEETDIIREILRGYTNQLQKSYHLIPDDIYSHDIFLSYEMAKQQCRIMKDSIINIVKRQQRKKIPSIINGVHIIPEEMYLSMPKSSNIVYLNLYIDSEESLWNRLKERNPQKYKRDCIPLLFKANMDLNNSLYRIPKDSYKWYSINVSSLSIQETLCKIDTFFYKIYQHN